MRVPEALTKIPDLLLRGRLSFSFEDVPLVAERMTVRKRVNLLKCGINSMLRSSRLRGLPPIMQTEPTNTCNLRCPLCPTGEGLSRRKQGFMAWETFGKMLEELGDVLLAVYFIGWGEPFLNKELPRMIKACHGRGLSTLLSTNGHFVRTPAEALEVVDSGLSGMIIATDGSTQDIYQAYRKGGGLDAVKRCAALVEEAKARRGSRLPYTNLRVVVTRDNQEDLSALEGLARELGVNMFSAKTLGCLVNSDKFRSYEPTRRELRRFEYEGSRRVAKSHLRCIFPFRQPLMCWDGTVVGCEYDYDLEAPWGKVGEEGFATIWNSANARRLRRSILNGRAGPEFCERCPFADSARDGTVIFQRELRGIPGYG